MEQLILRQFQQLPANLQQEVLDFIGYLFSKHQMAGQKPRFSPSSTPSKLKPAFGCGVVKIKIAADFDAPIDDFKVW